MRPNALNVLGTLLLLGLLGLALLAGRSTASAHTEPGTLVVGLAGEPRSLDPHTTTASSDFRVQSSLYEGLVRFEQSSLSVEPGLAERWEISDDGKRYRFWLKRAVRFHDGSPFDAAAVKFNFERMLDKQHAYHSTGPFPLAFFFEHVKRVLVHDAHSVSLELDVPFAPLLANLAYPTGFMLSPAAVKRFGRDVGRHPAGTGPFRFESWEPGSAVALRRNADYHGPKAASERLLFRPLSDDATRVLELYAGGLDLLPELSPVQLNLLRQSPDFVVEQRPGPHLWFLILNASVPPFDDVRVRRAANLAVDKRALVSRVLGGAASVARGPIAEAFSWAFDESIEPYPHDPVRARQLLAQAGYAGGVDVNFALPQGGSGMLAPVELGSAIQADLAEVGIRARIESYEWNTYLGKVNPGLGKTLHMAEMAWMTNDPDTLPFLTLRSAAAPPKGFNSGYYDNPRVDAWLEQARSTADRSRRRELYAKIQRQVHDDAPWIFVLSAHQSAALRRGVQGFQLSPSFLLKLDRARKQ